MYVIVDKDGETGVAEILTALNVPILVEHLAYKVKSTYMVGREAHRAGNHLVLIIEDCFHGSQLGRKKEFRVYQNPESLAQDLNGLEQVKYKSTETR